MIEEFHELSLDNGEYGILKVVRQRGKRISEQPDFPPELSPTLFDINSLAALVSPPGGKNYVATLPSDSYFGRRVYLSHEVVPDPISGELRNKHRLRGENDREALIIVGNETCTIIRTFRDGGSESFEHPIDGGGLYYDPVIPMAIRFAEAVKSMDPNVYMTSDPYAQKIKIEEIQAEE